MQKIVEPNDFFCKRLERKMIAGRAYVAGDWVLGKSGEKEFVPSCVVKVFVCQKRKKRKTPQRQTLQKQSIFPPFVPSQNSGYTWVVVIEFGLGCWAIAEDRFGVGV